MIKIACLLISIFSIAAPLQALENDWATIQGKMMVLQLPAVQQELELVGDQIEAIKELQKRVVGVIRQVL